MFFVAAANQRRSRLDEFKKFRGTMTAVKNVRRLFSYPAGYSRKALVCQIAMSIQDLVCRAGGRGADRSLLPWASECRQPGGSVDSQNVDFKPLWPLRDRMQPTLKIGHCLRVMRPRGARTKNVTPLRRESANAAGLTRRRFRPHGFDLEFSVAAF